MMLADMPPKRDIVRVPRKVADGLTFDKLPVLATRFLLRVFDAWQQRWSEIRHIRPSKRTKAHRTFRVKWSDLREQLMPASSTPNRNYRDLRAAIHEASYCRALRLGRGFKIVPFLGTVELDEDRSYLTFVVHEDIAAALDIIREQGFLSTPFDDLLAVTTPRQLALLLLVRSRVNLDNDTSREVSTDELREKLGFLVDKHHRHYMDWRYVWRIVAPAIKVLNEQTSCKFKVVQVKGSARKVVGLRFDPLAKKPKRAAPRPPRNRSTDVALAQWKHDHGMERRVS